MNAFLQKLFGGTKVRRGPKPRIAPDQHAMNLPWSDDYIAVYKTSPPLMRYKKGHGYLGVLLMRLADEHYQCHLCGEWESDLSLHIRHNHKPITSLKYKMMVGLGKTAKIRSMAFLNKMSTIGKKAMADPKRVKKSMKHLRKGWALSKSLKGTKIGSNGSHTMQFRNGWSTCDAQLGFRLKKLEKELGRMPKRDECTFRATLIRRYGSWNKALKHYGYEPRQGL